MTVSLESKRMLLRPIDENDGKNLFFLNSDPEVMKFLTPEHQTLEEANAAALDSKSF